MQAAGRALPSFRRTSCEARKPMNGLKQAVLSLCKTFGLFALTRYAYRRRLLILCYHGFELVDESSLRPQLFMRGETFSRRLDILRRYQTVVLDLQESLEMLQQSTIPANAAVITIDDGFYSVKAVAVPLLERAAMAATVYVTTYYVAKGTPVFRLAVQYLIWKARSKLLDLAPLGVPEVGRADLTLDSERARVVELLMDWGEQRCTEPQRQALCERLAELCDCDYGAVQTSRMLSLLTAEDLRELQSRGIDVQLHTHRHRLPLDEGQARRELEENREFLNSILAKPFRHLCYPSGEWDSTHWPMLESLGILSATTCEAGLNTCATPRYALRRFLDGEHITDIEFEAELCGFLEFFRMLRFWRERNSKRERGSVYPRLVSRGSA
jgi:peptidoglycan/xylan/chitin deacetylase (PgdA/CDA1 family)